jgi:hypothetical protein
VCLIAATVPNLILNSSTNRSVISFLGCVCQVLLVVPFHHLNFSSSEPCPVTTMWPSITHYTIMPS